MAKQPLQPMIDPEDMFADTRMSFGDHIEDLRGHFLRAIYGFLIGMVICIVPPVGPWAVRFITAPVEAQLQAFYERLDQKKPSRELLDQIPPVEMTMRIYLPSLKKAVEGQREAKALDRAIDDIDDLLKQFHIDPAAPPEDTATSRNWGDVKVQIPDPYQLSKAVNDVNRIARPKRLSTFNVQEAFMVYFKVGLLTGFVLSSPWVFYQLWSFVAAGLYPHEKKLVNYYLPVSLGLFLAGFFVCEFIALPKAIEGLLWFNEWLGFEPDLRLSEWLSFAIIMPLVFGLSFQTPIVMLFMFKIGIAEIQTFRNKRRLCYFLMAIFSAVITPSTDLPTMLMLWIPMCILFEAGIWLCIMQPRSLSDDMDDADLDEMVGV